MEPSSYVTKQTLDGRFQTYYEYLSTFRILDEFSFGLVGCWFFQL